MDALFSGCKQVEEATRGTAASKVRRLSASPVCRVCSGLSGAATVPTTVAHNTARHSCNRAGPTLCLQPSSSQTILLPVPIVLPALPQCCFCCTLFTSMGRNTVDLALQYTSGPALLNAVQVIWLPGISAGPDAHCRAKSISDFMRTAELSKKTVQCVSDTQQAKEPGAASCCHTGSAA